MHLVMAVVTLIAFGLRLRHDDSGPVLALASSLCVPLAFVAARAWSGSPRIGLFAAIFMALMPAAIHYGSISMAHAAAPALVWWSVWMMADDNPSARVRKWGWFALRALVPAGVVVLMNGARHLVLRWPDEVSVWRGLASLTLAERAGEFSLVLLGLMLASAILGCLVTRVIHQKEFAVTRCDLHVQELALPALMIVLALIASASFISPTAFDGATMVAATPALAMLLAWSFEALILEPRAQLPGPPTPETQSQRYGLVALASLALLAAYWRVIFS